MKQAGLKKKIIKVMKAPNRKSDRREEFEDKTLVLDEDVSRIL